jgi:hypothetical protein
MNDADIACRSGGAVAPEVHREGLPAAPVSPAYLPGVARMMVSIMQLASDLQPARKRPTVRPRDGALRKARTGS